MSLPKRPSSHVTGSRAVHLFKGACEPVGIVSEITPDYGLDVRIELTAKGEVTGQEIFAQVKGSNQTIKDKPTIYIRQETINYWLAKFSPVLIALVNTSNGLIWYDWLENAYPAYPKQGNSDGKVRLVLTKSSSTDSLPSEIFRYASRFFAQLGPTITNLTQRARLTEMLFHVVNMTHLLYDIWFYIGDLSGAKDNVQTIQEKLRRFYQEFGTHDLFLRIPWRQFALANPSPIVLDAFVNRLKTYDEIRQMFFRPGPVQEGFDSIPIIGSEEKSSGALQFIPFRIEELLSALGPAIHVLCSIEGLIFRLLLLGRIRFIEK